MLDYGKCLVIVTSQYVENGKFKGGVEFRVVTDTDLMMYGVEDFVKGVKEVLKGLSSDWFSYEYLSHEVFFDDPIDISNEVNTLLGIGVEVE